MKSLIASLFVLFIVALPTKAMAVDAGDWTNPNAGGSGAGCSFQDFKEYLGACESSGDCGVRNQYGYLGKYQFGHQALVDLGYKYAGGGWTGKDGINSEADFLGSCAVQEEAMQEWTDQLAREIENAGLDRYIGQNIGGCTVTMSGLIAGRHLKGIGCSDWVNATSCRRGGRWRPGLRAWLESNGSVDPQDANGTGVSTYVCRFTGFETPYSTETGAGCNQTRECGSGGGGGGPGPTHTDTPEGDTDGDGGYGVDVSVGDLGDSILNTWVASLMLMAEQFTVNMEKQMEAIGMFFDAKEQLETQSLLQRKTAEAHKDYQPSEQMCTYGTFARELAATDRSADLTRAALSQEILQRELGTADNQSRTGISDSLSRIKTFRDKFCNPRDNAWQPGVTPSGLSLLCPVAAPAEMQNRDIDYTRTIDMPLSLDVNLTDDEVTPDEEAIFALVDYLFMQQPFPRIPNEPAAMQKYQYYYMNMRSIVAMRGIARASFSNIIALKTASPENQDTSAPYLKALMRDMGVGDDEIQEILGDHPSYYAQMEFLTKKIYQNPSFYTNLYDKPANVERIRAAMQAIKLMNDRDIHTSLMRREMLLSMILELKLRQHALKAYSSNIR